MGLDADNYPMSPTSDKFVLLLCYAYDPSVA
jgi:hypothetical protein